MKIWFKDLWNGTDCKRLRTAKYRVRETDDFIPLDTEGDFIVLNGFSRSGGLMHEWDRYRDTSRFALQQLDGCLKRQNTGNYGIQETYSVGNGHFAHLPSSEI